ncbi:MAG: WG repeat-containing protein [Polaribacter sp.]
MKNLSYLLALSILVSCSITHNNLTPFETKEGWGYKKNGKIIIKPKYGIVGKFTDCGIAPVGDKTGNYYIDKKGRKLDIPIFETGYFIDKFVNGFARFKKNDKIGFINECGEIVIQNKFDHAEPFYNNISIVSKTTKQNHSIKKFGVINKKGKLIIPYKFDFIDRFNKDKQARARFKNKNVTINIKGEILK